MKVILLDTETMKTVKVNDDISGFQWAENNWSCDCNRAIYFGKIDDELDKKMREQYPELKEHQAYCYGSNRFLVISPSEIDGYNLKELNQSYPTNLVRKYLPKYI